MTESSRLNSEVLFFWYPLDWLLGFQICLHSVLLYGRQTRQSIVWIPCCLLPIYTSWWSSVILYHCRFTWVLQKLEGFEGLEPGTEWKADYERCWHQDNMKTPQHWQASCIVPSLSVFLHKRYQMTRWRVNVTPAEGKQTNRLTHRQTGLISYLFTPVERMCIAGTGWITEIKALPDLHATLYFQGPWENQPLFQVWYIETVALDPKITHTLYE